MVLQEYLTTINEVPGCHLYTIVTNYVAISEIKTTGKGKHVRKSN